MHEHMILSSKRYVSFMRTYRMNEEVRVEQMTLMLTHFLDGQCQIFHATFEQRDLILKVILSNIRTLYHNNTTPIVS